MLPGINKTTYILHNELARDDLDKNDCSRNKLLTHILFHLKKLNN